MRSRLPLCLALLALVACGDSSPGAPAPAAIALLGLVERGGTVRLRAISPAGDTLAAGGTSWSASPDSMASISGDSLTFHHAGNVTLTGRVGADGTVTRTIDVPPPPGVVFAMRLSGNWDIWRIALDGLDLRRLTNDPADDVSPTSAQGRVVFTSYRSGAARLWAVSGSGGTATQVGASAVEQTQPALSPNGRHLAWIQPSGGVGRLWLADGQGANGAEAAGSVAGAIDASPSWASDSRLAFTSTRAGSADIWQLELGGTPTLLAGGSTADVEAAWSPDGDSLVFASDRSGDTELWVERPAGSAPGRLTSRAGTDGAPSWLSGDRIVFVSWNGGTPRLSWIWVRAADTFHYIETGGDVGHPVAER